MNELEFKMEDEKFVISTNQVMDADVFKTKISNLESQKINFEMQEEFYTKEIERLEKGIEEAKAAIEANKSNVKFVTEDLEKAYSFLEENQQQQVIDDIKVEVEKRKEEMKKQMENQVGQ